MNNHEIKNQVTEEGSRMTENGGGTNAVQTKNQSWD
jgi:hypothetical protein